MVCIQLYVSFCFCVLSAVYSKYVSANEIYPVLYKELVREWPNLETFVQNYDTIKVKAASDSSIVFSNGKALHTLTIRDLLDCVSNSVSNKNESNCNVAFDLGIDKSLPRLNELYPIPQQFRRFHNQSSVQSTHVSSVLSIGGEPSGLPFHAHGDAWLGLLSGCKVWFMFPPGYSLPQQIQLNWNPYQKISLWIAENIATIHKGSLLSPENNAFKLKRARSIPWAAYRPYSEELLASANSLDLLQQHTYLRPLFEGSPYSDESNEASVGATSDDSGLGGLNYSPLWFVQNAGDAVYVPAGWSHMTLNVHPTEPSVGIGGQAVWLAQHRKSMCEAVLQREPDDYECLKSLATALIAESLPREVRTKEIAAAIKTVDCDVLRRATFLLRNATAIRPWHPDGHLSLVDVLIAICSSEQCSAHLSDETQIAIQAAEVSLDKMANEARQHSLGNYDQEGIAMAYHRLASVVSKHKEFVEDAIRIVRKSLSFHEQNMKALAELVLYYKTNGDFGSARETLDIMERYTPGHDGIKKMRELLVTNC